MGEEYKLLLALKQIVLFPRGLYLQCEVFAGPTLLVEGSLPERRGSFSRPCTTAVRILKRRSISYHYSNNLLYRINGLTCSITPGSLPTVMHLVSKEEQLLLF